MKQAKDKKRLQLSILLINKFRNKFKVNAELEPEVNKIIKDEVMILVNDALVEQKLTALDKRLDALIKQQRSLKT